MKQFETAPVFQALMQISIPSMFSMVTITLMVITKTILIGRFQGDKMLVAYQIFAPTEIFFFSHLIIAWQSGASVQIAKQFGQKLYENATRILCQYLYFVVCHSLFIPLIFYFTLDKYLDFIGVTVEVKETCIQYAKLSTLLNPLGYSVSAGFQKILFVQHKSVVVLTRNVVCSLLSIIIQLALSQYFKKETYSLIFSTFISNLVSGSISFWHVFSPSSIFQFRRTYFKFDWKIIKSILITGFPTLLEFMPKQIGQVISIIMIKKYSQSDSYTRQLQLIYGVSNRINSLLTMPIAGLLQGIQPLLGYNIGTKNHDRQYQIVITSYLTIIGFQATISIIVLVFAKQIFSLFTNSQDIYDQAAFLLKMHCGGAVLGQFITIATTILQQEQKTVQASILQFIRISVLLMMQIVLPVITKKPEFSFMANLCNDIIGGSIGAIVSINIMLRYYRKRNQQKQQ